MSLLDNLIGGAHALGAYFAYVAHKVFVAPGGSFALTSLLAAFLISAAFLILRRRPGRRRVRLKVLVRALLSRHWLAAPSSLTDLGFMAFNLLMFGVLFGWTMLAARTVSSAVNSGLVSVFGPLSPSSLPEPMVMGLMTVLLFLAYEFGYWLDHYLSHRIPLLWEFHKVHHAAEVLTPATNARVHPVDSIVFNNILALSMGLVGGVAYFLLGQKVQPYIWFNENAIALVFGYSLKHLQHSHMWIAFTGWWGKILLSPAHHQIHHSMNPIHFNRNMGGTLAIFDWLFGTLHIPSRKRERLKFGVEPGDMDPHSLTDSLIAPVRNAARLVGAAQGKAPEPGEVAAGR
ncbi:MAG: sterol desaturase family protein [Hyphomicrobiaceae bacterium]